MTARQERGFQAGAMGQPISNDDKSRAVFRRLMGYLVPYRTLLIFCVLGMVVAAGLNLIGPWLQGVAIDEFIADGDKDGLRRVVGLLAIIYVASWLSSILYARTVASVAQRVMATLRTELFVHLQKLSMRFFDRNRTGDLMTASAWERSMNSARYWKSWPTRSPSRFWLPPTVCRRFRFRNVKKGRRSWRNYRIALPSWAMPCACVIYKKSRGSRCRKFLMPGWWIEIFSIRRVRPWMYACS